MPYSAYRKLTWMNRNWTGKLQITEAVTCRLFDKKGVRRYFAKFTGKHLRQSLLFNNFIEKETLARVLFCEFYKISKNTFSIEHLRVTASEVTLLFVYISWKKLCSHTFKASSEKVIVMYSEKWFILRKWGQNAWRSMSERVFFVNLQVGISQFRDRLTSSHIIFRDFK